MLILMVGLEPIISWTSVSGLRYARPETDNPALARGRPPV